MRKQIRLVGWDRVIKATLADKVRAKIKRAGRVHAKAAAHARAAAEERKHPKSRRSAA